MIKNLYHFRSIALVTVFALSGCSLPANQSHDRSNILQIKTKWMSDPQADQNIKNGLTAYLALDDAFLSIASRIYLIRNAKHTLDLQYYIWNDDAIGNLMLLELLNAADRGVKIRLLIDDQNGIKLDKTLKSFPSLINPIAIPATGSFIGTPASINASDVPQTVAIEEEPLDSVISETTLKV